MKTNQAWGWLVAGVLAAGLNASYHDGGLQWAHRVADRMERGSAEVFALASSQAGQLLADKKLVKVRHENTSCPLASTWARVQSTVAGSRGEFDGFEAMSARQETQLAKFEAKRARIEARIAAAQIAHFRIANAAFGQVSVKANPVPVI